MTPFNHNCYTTEEVTRIYSARAKPAPRMLLGFRATSVLRLAAVFCAALAITWLTTKDSAWWLLPAACALGFWLALTNEQAREKAGDPVMDEIAVVGIDELTELAKLAEQFPAIRARVAEWMKDKKTIRDRDMRACRIYALEEGERVSMQAVLDRLSQAA